MDAYLSDSLALERDGERADPDERQDMSEKRLFDGWLKCDAKQRSVAGAEKVGG
jgi:hypothetical protein